MKIVHVMPGSGGSFYCQNCMRDAALVKELCRRGQDAVIAPMYLPTEPGGHFPNHEGPVFYGAVNVYLKQRFPWLRQAPRWLATALDSHPVLRFAARRAGSTRASGLEAMTLSVLRGEQGDQQAELDTLVNWLTAEQPDVVHLSNALLLGLARRIRQNVNVPLVCTLQDEDTWINAMSREGRSAVQDLMAERAKDVDAFCVVSESYAEVAAEVLRIGRDRMTVIPLGIDVSAYTPPSTSPPDPPVIGYLSRMSESLGFGILVKAFIALKKDRRFRDVRLRATGGHTGDDRAFLRDVRDELKLAGLLPYVEILDQFDARDRPDFLRSLTALSVPVPRGEAFGAYVLEALAAGVPVVQPRAGAFPEILAVSGGGILVPPDDPGALADALASLIVDPQRRRALGMEGAHGVRESFTVQRMAREMLQLYERVRGEAG